MSEPNETPHTEQDATLLPNDREATETPENTEQPEQPEEPIDPIDQLNNELKEAQDKYLRLYSDFDNFRKRSQKERLEWIKTASETVILSLLPILDDFDRALPAITDEATKAGVELIYTKLKAALEAHGLKAMEVADAAFDADLHEAVAQMPAANQSQQGKIIDEIQRGYHLNDKVIRHAKVAVAN